jgi:hypothetical protein
VIDGEAEEKISERVALYSEVASLEQATYRQLCDVPVGKQLSAGCKESFSMTVTVV